MCVFSVFRSTWEINISSTIKLIQKHKAPVIIFFFFSFSGETSNYVPKIVKTVLIVFMKLWYVLKITLKLVQVDLWDLTFHPEYPMYAAKPFYARCMPFRKNHEIKLFWTNICILFFMFSFFEYGFMASIYFTK